MLHLVGLTFPSPIVMKNLMYSFLKLDHYWSTFWKKVFFCYLKCQTLVKRGLDIKRSSGSEGRLPWKWMLRCSFKFCRDESFVLLSPPTQSDWVGGHQHSTMTTWPTSAGLPKTEMVFNTWFLRGSWWVWWCKSTKKIIHANFLWTYKHSFSS